MFTDYFFWFAQPSTFLTDFDKTVFYVALGLIVAGILFWVGKFLVQHPVTKQALNKWKRLLVWNGIFSVVWFGFRYQNTPIFARRYILGILALILLVWLFFVLKYMFAHFAKDKLEYDENALKSKYMPKSKK